MDIWARGFCDSATDGRLMVVHDLLRECLEQKISACPEHWSEKDPFHGTCAVVALLNQNLFGGKILRASLLDLPKYSHMQSHYWNRLRNGFEVDLTAGQFRGNDRDLVPEGQTVKRDGQTMKEVPITREGLLAYEPTKKRYVMLVDAWNRKNWGLGLGLEIID